MLQDRIVGVQVLDYCRCKLSGFTGTLYAAQAEYNGEPNESPISLQRGAIICLLSLALSV